MRTNRLAFSVFTLFALASAASLHAASAAPQVTMRLVPNDPSADFPPGESPAGVPCAQTSSTYSSFNFDVGGPLTVQAGMAETEIAAASYVLTAADFPVRLDRAQVVWGTNGATITTTTHWSLHVWQGLPNSGSEVISVASDGISIPHIVLPSGTNATVVQVDFLPDPPDHIVIQDNGSHTFSIGFRIDDHQQQTGNPCTVTIPSCCNAFPTTDTSGLSNSANNWLFGINCGPFGCPANGGWARFSQLPAFCRPSGDWNLRATYFPAYALGEIVTLTCADGIDNDCDGFSDCDDSDCVADPFCVQTSVPFAADATNRLGLDVPNPMRAADFTLRLHVPRPALVRLDVFDLQGRAVRSMPSRAYSAGVHAVTWSEASNAAFAPGAYVVRAEAEGFDAVSKKVVVVR